MGFFKEIMCSNGCGNKTNILTRKKLTDGKFLCGACLKKLPYFLREYDFDLDTYKDYVQYITLQQELYRGVFKETHSYVSIHVDTEHLLFYLSDKIFGSAIDDTTLFLKLEYIDEFELIFSPDTYKEGAFGDKLKGKVLMRLRMSVPAFYYEGVISYDESAKVTKSLFGSKYTIQDPPQLTEFLSYFEAAHSYARNASTSTNENTCYNDTHEENGSVSEIQQAMALFMIDNLDDISLDELKSIRNRLIKTFHPDMGTDFDTVSAQKINAAYEILKNALK